MVFILHFIKYTVEQESLQKATSRILINQHLNIPMDIKRFPCFASLFEQIYQVCNTFVYQRRHLQIRNIFTKSVILPSSVLIQIYCKLSAVKRFLSRDSLSQVILND